VCDTVLLSLSVHQKKKTFKTASTKCRSNKATYGDENYSDSEVCLSTQQAGFSRRSENTSQRKKLLKRQTNAKAAQIHAESGITTDGASISKSNKLAEASCVCPGKQEVNSISRYV